MDAAQMKELGQRIVPVLDEFGLTAFVLVGYLEDAEGKLQRVCLVNTRRNPAFEDGLRPVLQFANMWGANQPIPPSE